MVMVVTTLVLVAVAVAVVVAVVMHRQPSMRMVPIKEWLPALFPVSGNAENRFQDGPDEPVKPRTVSLRQFMNEAAVEGNAYVSADHIPGYEQLEHLDQVAKQWESRTQQDRRVKGREKVSR